MRSIHTITIAILGAILLAGCISKPLKPFTPSVTIGPYPQPHGRIILMGKHRAQLLFHCQKEQLGGGCQFTHGASGYIMELRWKGQKIWQRSNRERQQQWQPITMRQLYSLGLVIHPATMLALLNGATPPWLHPKSTNKWQGRLHNNRIQMAWYPNHNRLEITNLTKGTKIKLLLEKATTPQ